MHMEFPVFENKVWLATPTMHGDEMKYVQQAYDTNWMSTIGENINEVERIAAEKAEMKYAVGLSCCTAALHLAVKHAGERLYGKPAISHGSLEGKRVFCSDMTFNATLNSVVYEGGIPVFIDTEGAGGNGRADNLDEETRTLVCDAFCTTVKNAGFDAGVYASRNWLNNNLIADKLEQHIIWLAEYREAPLYQGYYQMWQYSSNGSIDGIEGRVDMNVSYLED